MSDAPVRTTCPYCGVGCGLLARRDAEGEAVLAGDGQHPANLGRLCSKGMALGETLGLDGRLLDPVVDGARADWDTALERVAAGFSEVIARHGPEAVAFYVSGQLLTEDYYVANKLMKGFIGAANIDTNSRLCMASSVAAHKRAFGADVVPGCYADLDEADLVVLVGSNAAWCHPILHQRFSARAESGSGPKIVVVDPRRAASCEGADLHLPLAPGTDAWLFNGLLAHLVDEGAVDADFVAAHTGGLDQALDAARRSGAGIRDVAARCGLAPDDVARFFELFAATERVVTLYSQGINQSSSGTDKVNAILNCHLATGRLGRPGMGPFSLTGQPNAMGGREVGGLANQLAAHMEIENAAHRDLVRRFWRAPRIARKPGPKAVDLFDGVADGRIKAVWIMATNPAVSLPEADRVRAAIETCPFVVVSDCVARTDTTAAADILLPAAAWGERDGTVTNSERRISRQRAFLSPPGEARPDWWIVCEVARRMGYGAAFAFDSPAAIFREHAALSGFENGGERAFDISALAGLDDDAYDALVPVQWPVTGRRPAGTPRLFADARFFTPDGRARFVAVTPRAPAHAPDEAFPFVLNTGRLRDHWHTLTRTGRSPRLSRHAVEPTAEIHPRDAHAAGVAEGTLVQIESRHGRMIARARLADGQRPGSIFVPMHWSDQFAAPARVDALVGAVCDPVSGQPESKHAPVRITPFAPRWEAFAVTRRPLDLRQAAYWARAAEVGCWCTDFAGDDTPDDWEDWARDLLAGRDGASEWLAYRDAAAGHYRFALIAGGRLQACLFVAPRLERLSRAWLAALFSGEELPPETRLGLLAGARADSSADDGPVVCSCFGVGLERIRAAIEKDGLADADEIGAALKAGTGCGTCRPELNDILAKTRPGALPRLSA